MTQRDQRDHWRRIARGKSRRDVLKVIGAAGVAGLAGCSGSDGGDGGSSDGESSDGGSSDGESGDGGSSDGESGDGGSSDGESGDGSGGSTSSDMASSMTIFHAGSLAPPFSAAEPQFEEEFGVDVTREAKGSVA
jgi:molybdate/tungstate transport system substrate-binding protein